MSSFLSQWLNDKFLTTKAIVQVNWKKPPSSWITLDIDRSAIGNPSRARGGGLLWNSEGEQIRGFSRGSSILTSCTTKFWVLKDDLNLASNLKVKNLIIESML